MKYLYFAYGANMNIRSMEHRCPAARPLGKARLEAYRLNFRRGVATVEPKKGSYVPGAMWIVTKQCIKSLDKFEGYPLTYGRFEIGGKYANGEKMSGAQIYIMQPGFMEEPPSKYYLETILRGYKDFGWGKKEREHLLRIAGKN